MADRRVYDPKTPGYDRRLRYLLLDPRYGPKMVRLSRADQQQVQKLINQNRGREARKLLLLLDELRRHKRTVRTKARRYADLTETERSDQWDRDLGGDDAAEFWSLYSEYARAA